MRWAVLWWTVAAVLGLLAAAVAAGWLPGLTVAGAPWIGWLAPLSLAIAIVYWRQVDPVLLEVLLRVLLALLPLMAIAGLFIAFGLLPLQVDPKLMQALIAGALLVAGWAATWLAAEYQRARDRLREEEERGRNLRDVLMALRSEIFTALQTLDSVDWWSHSAQMQEKMRVGGNDPATRYLLFTASESPPLIFRTVADQVPSLPEDVVNPVFRYYAAQTDLATLAGDCQRADFAALEAERRIQVYRRLVDTRIAALYWAVEAVSEINRALGVDEAEIRPDLVNNAFAVDQANRNAAAEST